VGLFGPLIMLFLAKGKFSRNNAKTALNWQLSLLVYVLIAVFLMFFVVIGIAVSVFIFLLIIPLTLFVLLLEFLDILFCIIAAVKAGSEETWKYPLSLRFFKLE